MTTVVVHEDTLPHNAPRRPRTRGIGPLGMLATGCVAVGLVIGTITVTFVEIPAGVFVFVLTGIFFVLAAWKDHHHRGPLEKGIDAAGWFRQRRAGYDHYLPGSLTVIGDYLVPGTGAQSQLSQAADTFGHSYAMLTYPQTGHHVINIKASPDGAALADAASVNQQDVKYAEWMAALGNEPDLEQVAITIQIAPDAYPRLQREINENIQEGSPELAQRMLKECLTMYPQGGGSTSEAFITLTFSTPADTDKAQLKADHGAGAMREQLSTRLQAIMAALPPTGAGPVSLMNEEALIEVVRCAYNPGDRAAYQELKAQSGRIPVMPWKSAGPAGAVERKGSYSAGGGTSITWETTGFVGSQIARRVMKPLVKEPPPAVHSMRVTWLLQPVDPARSGFIAEADHSAAVQRKGSTKKPSARAQEDVAAADRTRHAEANGKGLLNFACLVTATVLDEDDDDTAKTVRRARSGIQHLGPVARLMLRPMRGAQAAAFAQGLGVLGLVTSAHLLIPTSIRKAG